MDDWCIESNGRAGKMDEKNKYHRIHLNLIHPRAVNGRSKHLANYNPKSSIKNNDGEVWIIQYNTSNNKRRGKTKTHNIKQTKIITLSSYLPAVASSSLPDIIHHLQIKRITQTCFIIHRPRRHLAPTSVPLTPSVRPLISQVILRSPCHTIQVGY